MNDSAFDPNTLLQQQFLEANDTKYVLVEPGDYTAVAKDVKVRSGTIGRGERAGERYISLDISWMIDDQAVREKTGMDTPIVRQGLMMDLNSQGGFDMGPGRNVRLGILRAALGLNQPGVPFSFEMIRGRMAKVSVIHRTDDRPDSPTRGEKFHEVKAVAPQI